MKNGDILSFEDRQYKILEILGRGSNTVAYLAECTYSGLLSKCILKEYAPHNNNDFETGKIRFIASGKTQNSIRQISALNNQTPPVSRIFETNGTAYIDVACCNGTTLDKLDNLTLPQYMAICLTTAKTVGYYHKSGYLCLDLKPENIFILQNSPDDTISQLVEFIDFDSVREMNDSTNIFFSYTRKWAAPEQLNPCFTRKIGFTADIYTLGEIVFYLLFGRHSKESEHRGFSEYPFEECKKTYQKYTERPDIQALFTKLFRNTIRSSPVNRFKDTDNVTELLEKIVAELNRKDYIIPVFPSVSPDFVGRNSELKSISENLKNNPVLYVTGIGGIGKSTLIKNYISRFKADYDIIVYLEFDGDIRHTFCDDMQLQISTVSQQDGETTEDYFFRKFKAFRRICGERRVLFVLDNFSGKINKSLSRIIDCGYDIIIATRNQPPKNSFPFMEITAISDTSELFRLVSVNLERQLTKDEKSCFEEIITLIQGHTLVLELIARQISAGNLNVHTALRLIRKNGFSRFSGEKIGNYKDGEEIYDTLSAVISSLFSSAKINDTSKTALKIFSLFNVRGLEISLINKFFPDIRAETINSLSAEGWLYCDKRVHVHPVIAETVRSWLWSVDDVSVMEYHKKITDIYVGMSDKFQIREILREAGIFRNQHPRHITTAMYYDMLGCYYDTALNGAYYPENKNESELLEKLIRSMNMAISEMKKASDSRKVKYLIQYYLSMASVLIRSIPEYRNKAAEILKKAQRLIEQNEPEISENRCYYCMVSAWYYTLVKPDIKKTKSFTGRAEKIAEKIFPTDLEIIDIIHIPTANCYYYHNDLRSAAEKTENALEICRRHTDMFPYIKKQAELLNILLDIYLAIGNKEKCRELKSEADRINEILGGF